MDKLSTEAKIENLDNRIDTVVNSFEKMQLKLDQLISAIRGDDNYGTKGHAERLRELEADRNDMIKHQIETDRRIDKIYYRVLGICTGVSVAVVVFAWIFTNVVIDQTRVVRLPSADKQSLVVPKVNPSLDLNNMDLTQPITPDMKIPTSKGIKPEEQREWVHNGE